MLITVERDTVNTPSFFNSPRILVYRRVADVVTNIGQGTLDPIITPGGILLGEPQDQVDDELANARPADRLAFLA